jgi:acetoacetyl-[acyl-carrier protein] synthase
MARLPVIVGFGGFNASGRSSFHQGYQRVVLDSLGEKDRQETLAGLAVMMGKVSSENATDYKDKQGKTLTRSDIASQFKQEILDGTLIRPISDNFYDVNRVPCRQKISLEDTKQGALVFPLSKRKLPEVIPENWQIKDLDDKAVEVTVAQAGDIFLDTHYVSPVQSAGQLPEGFDPAASYKSNFHPRGLQLAVNGASDAVNSIGIDWQTIIQHVSPDQISAYSSSVMSQLDGNGYGGLLQSRLEGKRVSAKQLPLGFSSMTSDFVNAYVLGNLGSTGSTAGACASFLFNLKAGLNDIQSGRSRVAFVGSSEAPILPEVIEGYATMGALATVDKLKQLDGTTTADLRRSSRPFGENCGFVIAESTQHLVLMDDELAMELGADIYGSVTDVFINADGFKKSISAPGPGNYLTFAQAVASAQSLLGEEAITHRSFVQAHGSSTPQNRVTESAILDRVAETFNIESWPITAVKAFVGHSLGPASGDQLINTLGIFAHNILPGIKTIDSVAGDVFDKRLSISLTDRQFEETMDVAFLNSKGFGGNNATACVLSPQMTQKMLGKRYGNKIISNYKAKLEQTQEQAQQYHQNFLSGNYQVIYKYSQGMLDDKDISLSSSHLSLPDYGHAIDLTKENLYKDMV